MSKSRDIQEICNNVHTLFNTTEIIVIDEKWKKNFEIHFIEWQKCNFSRQSFGKKLKTPSSRDQLLYVLNLSNKTVKFKRTRKVFIFTDIYFPICFSKGSQTLWCLFVCEIAQLRQTTPGKVVSSSSCASRYNSGLSW